MSSNRHYVVGFFSRRTQAEKIFSQMIMQGISHKFVRIFDKYSILPVAIIKENGGPNNANVSAGGTIDSLAGTGLSTLLGVQLIASAVTLIAEGELIPPLVGLGWGNSLGLIATNFYTREDAKLLSDLVHDAVLSRQIVIVIETNSQEETFLVSDVIEAAMGKLSDVI